MRHLTTFVTSFQGSEPLAWPPCILHRHDADSSSSKHTHTKGKTISSTEKQMATPPNVRTPFSPRYNKKKYFERHQFIDFIKSRYHVARTGLNSCHPAPTCSPSYYKFVAPPLAWSTNSLNGPPSGEKFYQGPRWMVPLSAGWEESMVAPRQARC